MPSRPIRRCQSGKPEAVVEKMIEGRMRKFYEESRAVAADLRDDGETQIAKLIEKASKDLARRSRSKALSASLGEGIEKVEADFAAEVAQMAG
jgi:elongation factor Ts